MPKKTPLPSSVREHVDVLEDALRRLSEGAPDREVVEDFDAAWNAAYAAARRAGESRRTEGRRLKGRRLTFRELIADKLRRLRDESGWTQAQLADAMALQGFEWRRVTVAEVERADRRVSLEELLALAALFGGPVLEILIPDGDDRLRLTEERSLGPNVVQEVLVGPDGQIGIGRRVGGSERGSPRENKDQLPAATIWVDVDGTTGRGCDGGRKGEPGARVRRPAWPYMVGEDRARSRPDHRASTAEVALGLPHKA